MRTSSKFYDDARFKRGFSRSGFTIKEAAILESYGRTMKALSEGSMVPISDRESIFLQEVASEQKSTSEFTLCWLKYLKLSNTKPKLYTLCGTQRSDNTDGHSDGEDD